MTPGSMTAMTITPETLALLNAAVTKQAAWDARDPYVTPDELRRIRVALRAATVNLNKAVCYYARSLEPKEPK